MREVELKKQLAATWLLDLGLPVFSVYTLPICKSYLATKWEVLVGKRLVPLNYCDVN